MALTEQYLNEEVHPIDIVETLAAYNDWEFDRIADDQIAMAVEGQWRTYSITLAWSAFDESLRLICTFEMDPGTERMAELYETINAANDQCWAGAFSWWDAQKLMVYKYGLVLSGGQVASADQIDTMIAAAVSSAERYYPAFQLVVWGGKTPREALQVAIAEAYGRA